MTKEERVVHYLDLASMPENIPYDTRKWMQELGISDEDIFEYRQKLEDNLSMKPVKKRDVLVKQVIKPLLKKYGFSTSGLDWHRETDDSYIIIHMKNSQFNSTVTGVCFTFLIDAVKKNEIKGKITDQWMYGINKLNQFDFLPYYRMLSPYYSSNNMYKIDGYKNYLPMDMSVDDICGYIGEDFANYILPELYVVKSYKEFLELRTQKLKQQDEKEKRLLRYYDAAQKTAVSIISSSDNRHLHINELVNIRKNLKLNAEDIAAHIEWLDIFRENSDWTKVDAKEIAMSCAVENL